MVVNRRRRLRHVRRDAMVLLALIPLLASGADAEKGPLTAGGTNILVLDNCDSDFKTPPFDDCVLVLTSKGEAANRIGGFNVCQQIGGARAVAASADGRFFVVCESMGCRITAFELRTGKKLWSLSSPQNVTSAAVGGDTVYALTSKGEIYGSGIMAIDGKGKVIRQANIAGSDIVVDPNGEVLWLVGGDIKKCDTDLQVAWTIDPIRWCASSVDVNPDGSIWVAERRHPQAGGIDRLMKVSPQGTIVQIVPMEVAPMCVRVDPSDGSLWVTGIFLRKTEWPHLYMRGWRPAIGKTTRYKFGGLRTYKYSAQGKLLFEAKRGGHSLDLDPSDGSVWVGGESKLLHYSRNGESLGTYGGVSDDQKWIVLVPRP